MNTEKEIFQRAELLLGTETVEAMAEKKVILFGVGGVGSWCAEGLIRSGIHRLTIVDFDRVCTSNINRQLMATSATVGQNKVDALKERLLSINPSAEITALAKTYCEETASSFHLEEYDFVIDAIDSLENKAVLIRHACNSGATLFSSMGAALRLNPLKVDVAEFWKVRGCPLAAALRRRFKKSGLFPSKKFKCVYSEELLENKGQTKEDGKRVNGSLAHITAIFGFTLTYLVISAILEEKGS